MDNLDNRETVETVETVETLDGTEGTPAAGQHGDECAGGAHGYSPDKKRYLARLKRIEGQVRGLHRMVDEDAYCIDILTQVSAVQSALKGVSLALLDDHMHHCVLHAAQQGGEEAQEKLDEVSAAVARLMK